jgi:hypothetical protein
VDPVIDTVAPLLSRAKALRAAHAALAGALVASLGHLWVCAATGRRDRLLGWSLALLSAEGVALVIGRGDCPLGPLQARWGDPKPLLELILPKRLAKATVPVLTVVAAGGVVTLVSRTTRGAAQCSP